jgi:hypothetical protein
MRLKYTSFMDSTTTLAKNNSWKQKNILARKAKERFRHFQIVTENKIKTGWFRGVVHSRQGSSSAWDAIYRCQQWERGYPRRDPTESLNLTPTCLAAVATTPTRGGALTSIAPRMERNQGRADRIRWWQADSTRKRKRLLVGNRIGSLDDSRIGWCRAERKQWGLHWHQ